VSTATYAPHRILKAVFRGDARLEQRHIRLDLIGCDLSRRNAFGKKVVSSFRASVSGCVTARSPAAAFSLLRCEIEMHARHIAADAAHSLALWRDDIARRHRGYQEIAKQALMTFRWPRNIDRAFDLEPVNRHAGSDMLSFARPAI